MKKRIAILVVLFVFGIILSKSFSKKISPDLSTSPSSKLKVSNAVAREETTRSHPPSPQQSKFTNVPQFKAWLSQQARRMDQTHQNPGEIERNLLEVASLLDFSEAQILVKIISDPVNPSFNERRLANFLLTAEPIRFPRQLIEIVARPIDLENYKKLSHSSEDVAIGNEMSLQIQALKALEGRILEDPTLRAELESSARRQENLQARQLALASLNAAENHRMHWTEKYNELVKTASHSNESTQGE